MVYDNITALLDLAARAACNISNCSLVGYINSRTTYYHDLAGRLAHIIYDLVKQFGMSVISHFACVGWFHWMAKIQ